MRKERQEVFNYHTLWTTFLRYVYHDIIHNEVYLILPDLDKMVQEQYGYDGFEDFMNFVMDDLGNILKLLEENASLGIYLDYFEVYKLCQLLLKEFEKDYWLDDIYD